jgi:hypothetical protein
VISQEDTGPVVQIVNCDGDSQLLRPASYASISNTIIVCSTELPTGSFDTLTLSGSCCSEFNNCSGYTITNTSEEVLEIFYTDCQSGFTSITLNSGDIATVCSYTTPYMPGLPGYVMTYDGPC